MAHIQQQEFCGKIKGKYPNFFKNKKVLDIGSLDINGSNRELFSNSEYLGIDVGEGKNVDLVCIGHELKSPDNFYDVIISTEAFEHDMHYEKTILNVMRMLKPGGLFLFTCASIGRPEHGTKRYDEWTAPLLANKGDWGNYYKNLTEEDIRKIPGFSDMFPDGVFEYNSTSKDLYFSGIKKKELSDHLIIIGVPSYSLYKYSLLSSLILKYKVLGIEILLVSHFPIPSELQNAVDYIIYDGKNELLTQENFSRYSWVAPSFWRASPNYKIETRITYRHDYAIWKNWKNGLSLAKVNNKKYIHYLDYDVSLTPEEFLSESFENIIKYDACIYDYQSLDPEWVNSSMFSMKIEIFEQILNSRNSLDQYYSNYPYLLEQQLIHNLLTVTNKEKIYYSGIKVTQYSSTIVGMYNGYDELFHTQNIIAVSKTGDLYLVILKGSFFSEFTNLKIYRNDKWVETITSTDVVYDEHIMWIGKHGDKITIEGTVTWNCDTQLQTLEEMFYLSSIEIFNNEFLKFTGTPI